MFFVVVVVVVFSILSPPEVKDGTKEHAMWSFNRDVSWRISLTILSMMGCSHAPPAPFPASQWSWP